MDQAIAEKLQAMADEAGSIDQEHEFWRWSARVRQYLAMAVGTQDAERFEMLVSQDWPDTVASRRGYLEGLVNQKTDRRPTFEDKAKSIVATAAQVARMQNAEPVATLLEQSEPSLLESGSDPEGPTFYTLMLEVPVRTYAKIEDDREALEQIIVKRLRPILRPYPGNWVSEVIISPKVSGAIPPALTPESGEGAVEDVASFWQSGFFRLFVSHTSASKVSAHNLKNHLRKYHVACFVAHDDIEPGREWQAEIERALRTADALTAIVTPDFIESKWCDQEVGIAYGRGKLVIPLRKNADPHGFLAKYQGLQTKGLDAPNVAEDLVKILIEHNLTAQRMADVLVERLTTSDSFENAKAAMKTLEQVPHLNSSQIAKLVNSIEANRQVRDAIGVPERIRKLLGKTG
jgi:TIR domain